MFKPNEELNVDGIVIKFTGDVFDIRDRGTVYTAKLGCECNRKQLDLLIGKELKGKKILGIESFAVYDQSYRPIGILMEN